MCGIVGYIGPRETAKVLVDGLRRLEYRGYDSAGIAVFHQGRVEIRRKEGKLTKLEELIGRETFDGIEVGLVEHLVQECIGHGMCLPVGRWVSLAHAPSSAEG